MNKRELRRLSRADLLEMLIIKSRENERLKAELEEARALAAVQPAGPVQPAAADDQAGLVLRTLKTVVDRCLDELNSRAAEETKTSGEEAAE